MEVADDEAFRARRVAGIQRTSASGAGGLERRKLERSARRSNATDKGAEVRPAIGLPRAIPAARFQACRSECQ